MMNVDKNNAVQSTTGYCFRDSSKHKKTINRKKMGKQGRPAAINRVAEPSEIGSPTERLVKKIGLNFNYIEDVKKDRRKLPFKVAVEKKHKFKLIGNKKYFTNPYVKSSSNENKQLHSKSSSDHDTLFQADLNEQQQPIVPNPIPSPNHGSYALDKVHTIKSEDISFINSANKIESESQEKFILRTIFEEFAFFESLAYQENREVEITYNSIWRNLTRSVYGLPHTKYRFAGAFGSWLGRKGNYSSEFNKEVSNHLDELNTIGKRAFNYCKENHHKDKMQLIYNHFINCASSLIAHSREIEKKYKGLDEISEYTKLFKEKSDKFLSTANTLEKAIPQKENFYKSFRSKIAKITTHSEYENVIKDLKVSVSGNCSWDVKDILLDRGLQKKLISISCNEKEKKVYEQRYVSVGASALVSYNGSALSTKTEIFSLLAEDLQLNSSRLRKISKIITPANHAGFIDWIKALLLPQKYQKYQKEYSVFPNNELLEIHAVCQGDQVIVENHALFDLQKVDQNGNKGEIIKKIKIIIKSTIPKDSLSKKNLGNGLHSSVEYIFTDPKPLSIEEQSLEKDVDEDGVELSLAR